MIGIDIVETSRIEKAEKRTPGFLQKVFTEAELTYCLKYKAPYPRLAARFAAKEAVVKALGTGFRGIDFTDIEVCLDSLGKPSITFSPALPSTELLKHLPKQIAESFSSLHIELSLSHTDHYGAAVALIRL